MIIVAVVLVLASIISAWIFDSSELTHQTKIMTLADKWHEESCSPMYGSDGNYLGESCSDDWTFVLMENQNRKTMKVSGQIFKSFVAGDVLKLEFDKGKLGLAHNKQWNKV
jgi:hypothetical protein